MTKSLTRNSSKTTRIVLTLVLALALILAFSAPAFAVGEAANLGETQSTPNANNTGETVVTVGVTAANLSVTVPTTMTIVAPIAGGTCLAPEGYAIKNNSVLDVKVTGIQVTDSGGGLSFSDTTPGTTFADKDKVSIALTPTGGSAKQLTTAKIVDSLGAFDISAATAEGATTLGIAIGATSGMLTSSAQEANAFTITFTVAAGTTSAQQGE